jgi:hypothetical protein
MTEHTHIEASTHWKEAFSFYFFVVVEVALAVVVVMFCIIANGN